MLAFAKVTWLRYLLFVVLTFFAICGAALFLILPNIDHSEDYQEESPSVTAAVSSLADAKFAMALPWIITNGMLYAFVNGDLTADTVTPLLSESYVGVFMTVFFGADAVFSLLWGKLIDRKCLSRRSIFIFTGLLWIAFAIIKNFWTRSANFEKEASEWTQVGDIEWMDVALPTVLTLIAGAADGFWTPGPPAVLQSFFADSPNLTATMAAYKALQSLGFAIQFTLGATLHDYPTIRSIIILACTGVSMISVLCLDCFKQPLDPRQNPEQTVPLNAESPSKSSA
jgi:MFS family permease